MPGSDVLSPREGGALALNQGSAVVVGRRFESADQGFCEILGFPFERLQGKALGELYRTEQGLADFLEGLEARQGAALLTSWCRSDETVAEVVVRGRAVSRGEEPAWELDVIDLTEANRSARLEKRHELTLEAILRHSPLGFALLVLEPSGNRVIGWYNPAMALIFDYPPHDMIGQSSRVLYPDDESFMRGGKRIRDDLQQKGYSDFELVMMRRDTSLIDVRVLTIPVKLDNEISMLVIVDDISARKAAERALRESKRRLDTIVRTARSGIGILVDRRFTWCNEAMSRLLGYDLEELSGQTTRFLYANQETFERTGRELYEEVGTLGEGSCETTLLRKDGTSVDVIVRVALTDPEDPESPMVTTVADVTALKRAQAEQVQLREQLNHAQKLESVGRLAGGVAHDFNNLLTSITGNVALAQLDLPIDHPVMVYLEEVEKASFSAADLTRQLLAFSRKQVIKPRILNLNELIAGMRKMLIRLIGEDIDLRTLTPAGVGNIEADPGQVQQIIVNLAVNARDAMPEGGTLLIETADVVLGESYCQQHAQVQVGEYVMLAISDTGVGMDAETCQRVFEPFFTTKGEGEGTGLGLSTVHGIVQQHRGHVHLYSEPARGTTFKVYFPRVYADADDLEHRPPIGENLPHGDETVLVVEDDDRVRRIAVDSLERLGYRVLQCASGPAALALVQDQAPRIDLLMTDVIMPGMNGRELAERLESLRPGLRVLYASGYTDNIIAHHGVLEAGIELMSKPYSPRELAHRVRELLDA